MTKEEFEQLKLGDRIKFTNHRFLIPQLRNENGMIVEVYDNHTGIRIKPDNGLSPKECRPGHLDPIIGWWQLNPNSIELKFIELYKPRPWSYERDY
jgi:hypothetical protein